MYLLDTENIFVFYLFYLFFLFMLLASLRCYTSIYDGFIDLRIELPLLDVQHLLPDDVLDDVILDAGQL